MLERYRRTMNVDVLHSWAKNAQRKLDNQEAVLKELRKALELAYSMSPEGKSYLERIDSTLRM